MSSSRVIGRLNRRRATVVALLGALAVAALVLAGGTSAKPQATPFKAAWIYVGPHNDAGWSQAHDMGRLYVQKQLGTNVKTTYKENIAKGRSCSRRWRASSATATRSSSAPRSASSTRSSLRRYPNVIFEQATGSTQSKNLGEYFGAAEDSIYLSGMAAGAATKNGKIGYIVPFAIPEVIRHANAFALGAQATHPGATVKLIWTNAWFDPAKEKKAAESLVASGVDVLGQNVDSPAAGQYAQSKGIPWVGYDANAMKFAPTSWLTAATYNWGPYYLRQVQAAHERDLEVGLLLRQHEGRPHQPRPVRAEGERQDEGLDRGQAAGDQSTARSTSSPGRSRPERQGRGEAGPEAHACPSSTR